MSDTKTITPSEIIFSPLARAITESQTLAMGALTAKLKAQGRDIIALSAGELDCNTPEFAKEAGIAAIRANQTRYTLNSGTIELREEICKKYKREMGLTYSPSQVIVTAGAKQGIFNTLLALCGPGDDVIVIAPYWVSYPEQIAMTGARMVLVQTDVADGFQLHMDRLTRAITPRTKMIILNSPNNPTGAVYPERTIREVAELCVERGIWLLSDEIYEKILFPGSTHVSPAQCGAEAQARTIIVNGFSKTYAMTGWRLGFTVGPEPIIKACGNIQSHSTSNASSISQAAALGALRADDGSFFRELIPSLVKRRDVAIQTLQANKTLRTSIPEGAYYLMIDVSALFGANLRGKLIKDALDVAVFALEELGLATTTGDAFGAPTFIRLSFAADAKLVEEGCRRLAQGLVV